MKLPEWVYAVDWSNVGFGALLVGAVLAMILLAWVRA